MKTRAAAEALAHACRAVGLLRMLRGGPRGKAPQRICAYKVGAVAARGALGNRQKNTLGHWPTKIVNVKTRQCQCSVA